MTGILNAEEGISRLCELPEDAAVSRLSCAKVKDSPRRERPALRRTGKARAPTSASAAARARATCRLALAQGCDTFVTADVKHHQFIQANEEGINLIDAGHFSDGERRRPGALKRWLSEDFPGLDVRASSERHCQPEQFYV